MRRIERHNDAPPPAPAPTVVASGPPGAVRKHDPAEEPVPAPAKSGAPVVSKSPPAGNSTAPARTDIAEPVPPPAPAVTGGRGEAPDGFTFFSGLTVAGGLIAFAFMTFLRIGRSEGSA